MRRYCILPAAEQPGLFPGRVRRTDGILSPFFGGIVIAYILDPMVRFFHAKLLKYSKRWRWVAILLAYLVAVLLTVLLACWSFRRS